MTDSWQVVRDWLARRVHDVACDCPPGWPGRPRHADYYRSAVGEHFLLVPGVEVGSEYGVIMDGVFTARASFADARREVEFCNARDKRQREVGKREVVRLPAEPVEESP